MAIFPLTIPAYLNAFDGQNTTVLEVPYTSPTSYDIINNSKVESVIRSQSTNQILKQELEVAKTKDILYISLPEVFDEWNGEKWYKIQVRYTTEENETSEWSTVCYVKGIQATVPMVTVLGEDGTGSIFNNSPTFKGSYEVIGSEYQETYEFILYQNNVEIETSGELNHEENNSYDLYTFKTALVTGVSYKVIYKVKTKNGYETEAETSNFVYKENTSTPSLFLAISASADNVEEESFVKILINDKYQDDNDYQGTLILRRSDESSGYQIWEDYKRFNITGTDIDIEFHDYLIENGKNYQYCVQIISKDGVRSPAVYSNTVYVHYEHMYLVGDDCQLKIKFNPQISSYKRQLQETKTETIGSKYPFIRRNGDVNYFTFPISGLISYYMDEAQEFMKMQMADKEVRDEGCLKGYQKRINENQSFIPTVNLTNDNITLERAFREEVEKFLTNGNPKYFKSPTEGVKIVSIMGVSMTPNATVGRMLYSFSATANEIMETNLHNALEAGIISKENTIYKQIIIPETKYKNYTFRFEKNPTAEPQVDLVDYIKINVDSILNENFIVDIDKLVLTNLAIEVTEEVSLNEEVPFGFKINDENDKILFSPLVKYYTFGEEIQINKLIVDTSKDFQATFTIVYSKYIEDKEDLLIDNYTSSFFQIAQDYNEDEENSTVDLIKEINSAANADIRMIPYLRLELAPGKRFSVNGVPMIMNETCYYEVSEDVNITSVTIDKPAYVFANVIYTGFKKAGD